MDRAAIGEDCGERSQYELPPRRSSRGGHDANPCRCEETCGRERDAAHEPGDWCGEHPAATGCGDRHDDEWGNRGRGERHGRAGDSTDEVTETHDVQTVRPG